MEVTLKKSDGSAVIVPLLRKRNWEKQKIDDVIGKMQSSLAGSKSDAEMHEHIEMLAKKAAQSELERSKVLAAYEEEKGRRMELEASVVGMPLDEKPYPRFMLMHPETSFLSLFCQNSFPPPKKKNKNQRTPFLLYKQIKLLTDAIPPEFRQSRKTKTFFSHKNMFQNHFPTLRKLAHRIHLRKYSKPIF